MKYYILFLALACFLYGLWAILTGKLLGKDGKDIAEKYRRRYARICGTVLLILSADLGVFCYLEAEDRLYALVRQPIFLFLSTLFVIVPVAVLRAAKRVLKK